MSENKPWLKYYGIVPTTVDYPKVTLYEKVADTAQQVPNTIAWDFKGTTCNYKNFVAQIDKFADALASLGFKKGDIMTISMPTAPNAVIPIYAVNKLGGVASMIHPLSPAPQIEMYLRLSKSNWAFTVDGFYPAMKEAITKVYGAEPDKSKFNKLILTCIPDYLKPLMKIGFNLTLGKKITTKKKTLVDPMVVWYNDMMKYDVPKAPISDMKTDDMAIILYSGGTTGIPKGIMLSNYNMISEGMMVSSWVKIDPTDSMLAILPVFHGFGLGVCVNALFMAGGKSILVPTFTPETVAKIVKKQKPTYLIGVPTLFEALASNAEFQSSDLSCLKATFCGADTLPVNVKKKFEETVKNAGGKVKLLEGYGLTEAVTAIMATPITEYREGAVGIPFPDMLAKIVKQDTINEVPIGEEGEICVSGPAVMLGYLNNPEATKQVLKKHADGRIWLHTGDLGKMDKDGFFYFKLRIKRMLKVSGINVYPANVEETIRKHPDVKDACVIGVPDQKQISRVKAFVILKDPSKANADTEKSIKDFCIANLLKWESPRDIEFKEELPKTLVGKIHWKKLEDEEVEKMRARGEWVGN
jgi:long-chain acyl-CoA synthetase